MKPFYITTPIYYVNDVPHLGHAYTTIAADALARYHRMRGDDTRLLTGTDEHGQKVEETAKKRGLTPRQLTDEVAPRFVDTWRTLGISNDDFIRTTEPRHAKVVHDLWHRIAANGDLYLETYQGWYCVGCEAFYTESQLEKVDDTWQCTTHKRPVDWVDKERSWFFKLSKYQQPLLDYIAQNPSFIQPEQYRNEVVSFVKGGLKDLSVSRTSFDWGIPVPQPDPEGHKHVIYVWMDALTNYLSALGEEGSPERKYWPATCHLIGKDILRFHAVYWPCFLMSAGLPLPRTVYTHGWWTVKGQKIAKSMPATRIAPLELSKQLGLTSFALGVDAMRYYLLREIPLGNDGDFTFESMFSRYNADLANDLGNLVSRSLTMIGKFGAQAPPRHDPALAGEGAHKALADAAATAIRDGAALLDTYAVSRSLEAIWALVREGNRYVDATQPWVLARDPAKAAELGHVLHGLSATMWLLGRLIAPVLPEASRILRTWLGDDAALTWPEPDAFAAAPDRMPPGPGGVLFPRLDDKKQAAIEAAVLPLPAAPAPEPAAAPAAKAAPIAFDDFAKVELRVGKVLTAVRVPKADKLLHLSVDLGEAKPRSIVAGIAQRYAPEELVGRQVLVVANLAPRTMRGLVSEGMILAAGDDAILGLGGVDADVPPGTRVR